MATLSNKYYLQALDAYPYDLGEAIESLNYALSYNQENAQAHCLLGQLYMDHLKDYSKAEHHYEQALISDMHYVITYEKYSLLMISLGAYSKASKLIKHAQTIKGINQAIMLQRKALIAEVNKKYSQAKVLIKQAYNESWNEDEREFLKNELNRIKSKIPKPKKKSKKKKGAK